MAVHETTKQMDEHNWTDVPGFEGRYQASIQNISAIICRKSWKHLTAGGAHGRA
jgi:hypothetical protein